MAKLFFLTGTIGGFLSVALGAFAAHELKRQLTPVLLNTFKTAVEYQFMHSLALILIAIVITMRPNVAAFSNAGWSIITGIVLFSGSLYLLALTGTQLVGIGIITPIGGLAFLIGWAYFSYGIWKAF